MERRTFRPCRPIKTTAEKPLPFIGINYLDATPLPFFRKLRAARQSWEFRRPERNEADSHSASVGDQGR
jgi:hypothetical protein